MNKRSMVLSLALIIVCGVGAVSQAIGTGWMDNFEQAKAKAALEDKDLLVDFTGSDWCGWCIRLNKEVFDKDIFKTEAPKEFVLVALDYPNDKSLVSEETAKQNAELKNEYGIRGYPTIYLMDELGRPYAQTGYQAGGPETYLAHLTELQSKRQARDEHFSVAKGASTDSARGKSIDAALDAVGTALASKFYEAEIEQVMALDPDNKAGLKNKYEQLAFDQEMATFLSQNKLDEAAQALEETLKIWNLSPAETLALKSKYEQQISGARIDGLLRGKKYDEAIELIEGQIKTKDITGQALIDLQLITVRAYSMKGDSETAIKTVDAIIEKNHLLGAPLQEALSSKAQVYQASGENENMKKVLVLAVKAAPDTPLGKNIQSYLDRMKENEKK